jgi:hypothetical protein
MLSVKKGITARDLVSKVQKFDHRYLADDIKVIALKLVEKGILKFNPDFSVKLNQEQYDKSKKL